MHSIKKMYLKEIPRELFGDTTDQIWPNEIRNTIVTLTERQPEGNLLVTNTILSNKIYTSEYWKQQPNGEHVLGINHGGITNRNIPREEKIKLKDFISHHFADKHTFIGLIKAENLNGTLSQLRIEPRY